MDSDCCLCALLIHCYARKPDFEGTGLASGSQQQLCLIEWLASGCMREAFITCTNTAKLDDAQLRETLSGGWREIQTEG